MAEITEGVAKKLVPPIKGISPMCSAPWGILIRIPISCRMSIAPVLMEKMGERGMFPALFLFLQLL